MNLVYNKTAMISIELANDLRIFIKKQFKTLRSESKRVRYCLQKVTSAHDLVSGTLSASDLW